MDVTVNKRGALLEVALAGELDQHSAAELRSRLDEELQDRRIVRIEYDLRGLSFMDSSGIGVLLGRYRTLAARKGTMDIRNARRNVEMILRMSGVYSLCTERSRQ